MAFTLETPRLYLRPLALTDLEALYRINSQPKVYKYDPGYLLDYEQQASILATLVADFDSKHYGDLAIILKATQEFIGYCGLEECLLKDALAGNAIFEPKCIELHYALSATHWGQGYVNEASRAVIGWAFEDLGFERVVATVKVSNAPSLKSIERLGMQLSDIFFDEWIIGYLDKGA